MYEYKIHEIKKIYDGDTITVVIDLGFGVYKTSILRLAFIDAPEIRGEERPEGLVSRDWLRNRIDTAIANDIPIYIKTFQDHKGKYGRYIADIIIEEVSVNKEMIDKNLARTY